MKLIESKVELLPWEPGVEGVYKAVERAGRTCYRSEDKMTDGSAKGFVGRMIASKHTAMLEHGTVYLSFEDAEEENTYYYNKYSSNKYSVTNYDSLGYVYVTTNLRVLVENNWLDDLQYLCGPTENHEVRYSFKFTCSRAIANELIRHRVFSFAQESQRYCNYSKDKFGNEITFIIPSWANSHDKMWVFEAFQVACQDNEYFYFKMLNSGATPQQARDVLPNATKTELVMTGYESDWRYLFDLRLFGKTGTPHPDMVDLMKKAKAEAEKNGIWNDIMSCPSKFKL